MRSPRSAWIDNSGDLDGDGFVEYRRRSKLGLLNQGWKDSGDAIRHTDGKPADGPIALAEVQGYVYAAKRAMARLARHRGEMELAARLDTAADVLRDRFDDAFWMPKARFYAMALDGEKRQVGSIGSNVGQALWTGIVPAERAARVAERILEPDMFSGWGVRTFASGQPGYNPVGYHTGSIWPHDNALIAAGLKASGATDGANLLAGRLIEAAQWFPDLRLPELFCGFTRDEVGAPVAYPVACSPQAWAAAAPFYLLHTMLGLRADATAQPARADPAEPARVARQDHHHGPAGRQAFGRLAGPSLARPDERRAHRPARRDRRHHPRLRRVTNHDRADQHQRHDRRQRHGARRRRAGYRRAAPGRRRQPAERGSRPRRGRRGDDRHPGCGRRPPASRNATSGRRCSPSSHATTTATGRRRRSSATTSPTSSR